MPNDGSQKTAEEVLAERLKPILDAVAQRIHYAEQRRTAYSVMSGALIAAGVTILTFSLGTIETLVVQYAAAAAATTMVFVGISILIVFALQTNRYPFTGATTTWKWFYRNALHDYKSFNLSWVSYLFWKKEKARVTAQYEVQLPKFKAQTSEISDIAKSVDQDLQQLYTLHINELYKNLFLTHLRTLYGSGIVLILVAAILGGLVGAYNDRRFRDVHQSDGIGASVQQSFRWQFLSASRTYEALLTVEASVTNSSPVPANWQNIVAIDEKNWPLPAVVSYPYGKPEVLSPGEKQKVIAQFQMRRDAAQAIHGFTVHFK